MPRNEIDANLVLPLWQKGLSASEIAKQVHHPSGAPYTETGIRKLVARAREAGDPRAGRRRAGRKPMPAEERLRRFRGRVLAHMRRKGHEFAPQVERDFIDGLCVIHWNDGDSPVVDYSRKWGEPDGANQRDGEDAPPPRTPEGNAS